MFDEVFLREVDRAMRRAGYSERSRFIRDAVYEKLSALGIRLSHGVTLAPGRVSQIHNGHGDNVFHSMSQSMAAETPESISETRAPQEVSYSKKASRKGAKTQRKKGTK